MPFFNFPAGKKVNICVIGDIMLDHYIKGVCERISPEAPVQVVDVATETYSLGGAGNVLKNLKAFGCESAILSICGTDNESIIMDAEVENTGAAFYHLIKDSSRRTTLKSRVVVNRHQLLRLDKENKHDCDNAIADNLLSVFKLKANEIDVLIISDYCKGVLSPYMVKNLLEVCKQHQIITIVDSKHKDLSKYRGATVIKPNKKEAILASGINIIDDASLELACKKIAELTTCDSVVITLSEDGIATYHDGNLTKIPTKAIEVYDVTGAGDTVVAALAFALANNVSITEACNFANHAAAVVVAKFGSAVASLDEINKLN